MDVDSDEGGGDEPDQILIHNFQETMDEHHDEVIIPFSNHEVSLERAVNNLEPNRIQPENINLEPNHVQPENINLEPNSVQPENLDHNYVDIPINRFSNDERVPSLTDLTEESNHCHSQETSDKNHEYEDDGDTCPICLDSWTNSGEHRICALKCGHLFGYKCLNRWLESQPKKSCPTCKNSVRKNDLRFIYAKKLVAVDTAELDLMKQQLDLAIEERNRALMDISKYVCREHILNQEIAQLKKEIEELKNDRLESKYFSNNLTNTYSKPPHLFMDKSLEVCRQNGSRVFDASSISDLIIASAKSPNGLFSGFGIRKFNTSCYKPLAFIPLHNKQIRDVCFHPVNNWFLTTSLDKSFKVVDTISNVVSHTSSHTVPLWSCCWDNNNQNLLYVGTQSGDVVKYDVRVMNTVLSTLSVPGDMSPVVSVASLPSSPTADLVNGGVISCKLNSLWAFENAGNDYKRHSLSIEGPFISMKYNASMKQLLISSRPNNRISYSRHSLCTLEKSSSEEIQCNIIHTFQGGGMQKLLSKSCFVTDKQDYVAAYQESSKSVWLWSISSGQRVCSVPAHEPILDLGSVQNQNGNYLITLTEKKLEFFKFS
nr:E3 ubiquitin-protein ligase RFWD3-like isoform X1 [Leptinotarsa decemlineata]